MIEYLPLAALDEAILRTHVFPRMDRTFYWSDCWDPDYYVAVARSGFICISAEHPELGHVLIPEMQPSYAVLDWENLHASRNLRRVLRSQLIDEQQIELRITNPCDVVIQRLAEYHGESSWLYEPYVELIRALSQETRPDFAVHGVELWSKQSDELIAGELGYSVGATYTSLSGFCRPDDREWRNFGTLQQYLLAQALAERGYAFWNMGHVGMAYKFELGAKEVARGDFLERWFAARDECPERELGRT